MACWAEMTMSVRAKEMDCSRSRPTVRVLSSSEMEVPALLPLRKSSRAFIDIAVVGVALCYGLAGGPARTRAYRQRALLLKDRRRSHTLHRCGTFSVGAVRRPGENEVRLGSDPVKEIG